MGNVQLFMPYILNLRSSNFHTDAWVFALLLLILTLHAPAKIAAQDHPELYEKHCKEFVPAAQTVGHDLGPPFEEIRTLEFFEASYTGGDSLFNFSASVWNPRSKSVVFSIMNSLKTDQEGLFKIVGRLSIRSGWNGVSVNHTGVYGGHSPFKRTRPPRFRRRAGVLTIDADGFWSNSSGRACMVGSGQRYFSNSSVKFLSVSVRFSYPRFSTILSSEMNGTVESLDEANSFEPIRISAAYDGVYEYTRVEDAIRVCKNRSPDVVGDDIDVLKGVGACSWGGLGRTLQLEYNSGCHGFDCSPFNVTDSRLMPSSLVITNLRCTQEGHVHGFFEFSHIGSWALRNEVPSMMLIGEGQWDDKKGQLCMVACRVGAGGRKLSEEEDCGISISMQFPRILTVSSRDVVVGHVQSERKVNESMYFKNFTFRGSTSTNDMVGGPRNLAKQEYKYTKLEKVNQHCSKFFMDRKRVWDKKSDRKYPDGNSFADLGFDASVRILPKERRFALIYPFTIQNKFEGVWHTDMGVSGPLNVSYNLKFRSPFGYLWDGPIQASGSSQAISAISAEGIYDRQTGSLCMIGCRQVGSPENNNVGNMDCEILIEVEYAPTDPELFAKEHLSGKITSLRTESHPLYFKPMALSSTNVYRKQAKRTVWRKDLEIAMGLGSLSFTTLFIIAQLLYIKKHPTCLPFISLLMLSVLTLGHMIPLVLNFEAFFTKQKEKNVFQTSGGWLEVNEVIVRVMTMIAFLFQLRLLQLAWTARHVAAGEKSAWFWERKVLYFCFSLYVFGGLIACLVHWVGASSSESGRFLQRNTEHLLWEDFRSYAGLILDGFLLPQVLGNLFWDIKDTILVPYFYIGITLVRSVPHFYDAYRAILYIPDYSSSYFYANPDWDFYSTAWDVVIPCGALFLALLVFLQQRFGGRCIVPRKFRDHLEYQKIPVVDG